MKKLLLSLTLFCITSGGPFALAQDSMATSKEKTYSFPNSADKKKDIGTIKFEESQSHIVALFEGAGLKKGKYHISKVQKCKVGATIKFDPALEILGFETVSGDSSTEKNLTETKIADLLLDQNQLALVKGSSKNGTIISCAVEKTP